MFCLLFLCKQKTAYEMRISDWSSDVCSSDLCLSPDRIVLLDRLETAMLRGVQLQIAMEQVVQLIFDRAHRNHIDAADDHTGDRRGKGDRKKHTSELQSLMRTSYAVFCLKKKNNT